MRDDALAHAGELRLPRVYCARHPGVVRRALDLVSNFRADQSRWIPRLAEVEGYAVRHQLADQFILGHRQRLAARWARLDTVGQPQREVGSRRNRVGDILPGE